MRRATVVACGAVLCVGAVGVPALTAHEAAASPVVTRLAASAEPGVSKRAVPRGPGRTIEVWMAGDQRAAARYAEAVSTPGSPSYRRFLSPVAYSQRFGPSARQVRAVESFLHREGFSDVRASVDDAYVSATATATAAVSRADRAFAVALRGHRLGAADGRPSRVENNDRAFTVPARIGSDVLAVTGPESGEAGAPETSVTHSSATETGEHHPECSRYWAQRTTTVSPAFDGLTRAAVAVCGYSAQQIRAAYGLPAVPTPTAPTGTGKTIAIIEIGAPTDMARTLADYAHVNGLSAPRAGQFREQTVGRGGACGNTSEQEEQLDSEAAYAMAPGADQVMVDGSSCFSHDHQNTFNQNLFDAELAPLTGHGSKASADIEFTCQSTQPLTPDQERLIVSIDRRAADEGVSMLNAAGDHPGTPGALAGNPDVTSVGGTTLGIGAGGQRLFETGWSDLIGRRVGSSGPWQNAGLEGTSGGASHRFPPSAGASTVYPEPRYQRGVVPDAMARNPNGELTRTTPDIAADADIDSGMLVGEITPRPHGGVSPYTPIIGSGTSEATPLVAGIVADAEQGQSTDFGFLNPLLYSLAGSTAYNATLPLGASTPAVDRAAYGPTSLFTAKGTVAGTQVEVFDDENPKLTSQLTSPGYDTMTGLGTPNGYAFIDALRRGG